MVPIAPDLTTRMGAVLEAVQREADRIIDAARAEAQEYERTRAPAAEASPSEPASGEAGATAEAQALRVAMQMAAVGCTRSQVESHLRAYLRFAEPTQVLDRVYGLGTGPGARVPWAVPPG